MNNEHEQSEDRPQLWDDPVIEEVRAIRRRLWEQSGRDIHRFIEQTREAANRYLAANEKQRDAG